MHLHKVCRLCLLLLRTASHNCVMQAFPYFYVAYEEDLPSSPGEGAPPGMAHVVDGLLRCDLCLHGCT